MKEFTHIKDATPHMVNVGEKSASLRKATARCEVQVGVEIMEKLLAQNMLTPKGAVEHTAILAGILGAKKTSELIPLCHPLMLEHVDITIEPKLPDCLEIRCTTRIHGKTGVEMEALTGASIAALTIYDMCKAMSHDITINRLELIEKTGGKKDVKKKVQ